MVQVPGPPCGRHNPAVGALQSIHASCVALDGFAILFTGPSGAGKSELALRMIDAGFVLLADDRVELDHAFATAPENLRGLLEVRGVGILRLPFVERAEILLHVGLGASDSRLPESRRDPLTGAVSPRLEPSHPAAVARIRAAFLALRGGYGWHSGGRVS